MGFKLKVTESGLKQVEDNKVEEKGSNPFNDLINQTAIQASNEVKQEAIQKIEDNKPTAPVQSQQEQQMQQMQQAQAQQMQQMQQAQQVQEQEQLRQMQINNEINKMRQMEQLQAQEQLRQQMYQTQLMAQQAQTQQAQQQFAQEEIRTITIVLIENEKLTVPMPASEFDKFLEDLNMCIAETTTIRVGDIVINCRNIKYYIINQE